MTPHQILIVGIRVLVVFWLLSLIGQAGAVLTTFQNMNVSATPFLISMGLQLVAIVALWLFPATFASKLLRAGNVPVQVSAVTLNEWRELILVGIGVFVLARAIPDVIYWALMVGASEATFSGFTLEQKASALVTLLELAIGLILTLGAAGIAALIQKGRRVGVTTTSN